MPELAQLNFSTTSPDSPESLPRAKCITTRRGLGERHLHPSSKPFI